MVFDTPKTPEDISFDYPRYRAIAEAYYDSFHPVTKFLDKARIQIFEEATPYAKGTIVYIGHILFVSKHCVPPGKFSPSDWDEMKSMAEEPRDNFIFKGLSDLTQVVRENALNYKERKLDIYIDELANLESVLGHIDDRVLLAVLRRGTVSGGNYPSGSLEFLVDRLDGIVVYRTLEPIELETRKLYGRLLELDPSLAPQDLDARILSNEAALAVSNIRSTAGERLEKLNKIRRATDSLLVV